MGIYKQNMKKIIFYIKKKISAHIIKITSFLRQTLPHSYMPYIELVSVVKKL